MATKCETEILTLEHYLQLKADGFEFEGQSYLFWEYMRLLNEVKPKYFLLENVEMGEKWERILSKAIGVNGIHINSSLVSAQNRKRIYWTNIGMESSGLFGDMQSIIKQPKDKGILLKDILQDNPNANYYLNENQYNKTLNKTNVNPNVNEAKILDVYNNKIKEDGKSITLTDPCHNNLRLIEPIIIDEKYYISDAMINRINRSNNSEKCFTTNDKSMCLAAGYYKQGRDNQYIVHNTMPRSSTSGKGGTGPLSRADGKTYCLDTGNTNAVEIKAIMLGRSASWGMPENGGGKSYTLCKEQPHGIKSNSRIRRLTPIECERLQTVKDNYTNHVSDSQRYKMLGNGWTIDVICHILNYIK
jgi:DNA (cytosine-5)-methyltransferase 3A